MYRMSIFRAFLCGGSTTCRFYGSVTWRKILQVILNFRLHFAFFHSGNLLKFMSHFDGQFHFSNARQIFSNTVLTIFKSRLSWYLEDLGKDGIIILKWFIKIQIKVWTGFLWLTIRTSGGLLWQCYLPSDSKNKERNLWINCANANFSKKEPAS
jgi:hypothetical protein